MNKGKISVSVIIPCFNAALYLRATLHSVLMQTEMPQEIILIDDGSSDDTLSIMRQLAAQDNRIKVIALPTNQGLVVARNAGLAIATGEYIAMLDGDDIWTPDALELRVELARQYTNADVIATDFAWFRQELPEEPIGRVGLGPRGRQAFASCFATFEPVLLETPFELIATVHFAWVGATLVRRAAMTAIGNFEPSFKGPEDTLLWLRLAQRGAFVFAPKVTVFYRQHAGSLVALLKGPKELHYLKVLGWVRSRPEFARYRNVIKDLSAECHYVSAHYYHRVGRRGEACWHDRFALVNIYTIYYL